MFYKFINELNYYSANIQAHIKEIFYILYRLYENCEKIIQ